MKASRIGIVLVCTASVAFVGWRVLAARDQYINHFEVLHDPSSSYTGNCESIVGVAAQMLKSPAVSTNSTLVVLTLGERATANEPRRLGMYVIPMDNSVIDGRSATSRRKADILKDILSKCRAAARTSTSPIFLGVKQAIADLRGRGCVVSSHCELWVSSDLEENVEVNIRNHLNNAGDNKRPLPSPLDNNGIDIIFCGLASTAGQTTDLEGHKTHRFPTRDADHEDRIRQTWLSVFTKPDSVRLEPYCPTFDSTVQ